jgi:hypothetical protein
MKQLFIIWMLCLVSDLFAITDPITGFIFDAKTKEPLPFANIVVIGQHRGSVSNSEGIFVLDMDNIAPNDTIFFSYMGYETLKVRAAQLRRKTEIYMHQATVNIREVEVLYKSLSAKEIVALARKNYDENHPISTGKQQVFFHNYEKVPFPETNQIILKKSDFVGLDKHTFDEVLSLMPGEFIEYQDALVELYSDGKDHRLVPLQGISLEEESMQALGKEMENRLSTLFDDIQKTQKDEDIYYKFRSGIFSQKLKQDSVNDLIWEEYKNDTLNYTVETEQVKNDVLLLFEEYARLGSKNWEFIKDRNKYKYTKEEVTVYNDELVYRISFIPENRGLFEGIMYVSTTSYAILQLDFAFAEGKQNEKFQFAGFGHLMDFKKGRVIFEKGNSGYFVKYINAQQHELATVDRNFSVMKKQKRTLVDKELNEFKLEVQLAFDIESSWELLVLDREEIDSKQFAGVQQPLFMKFRKEYAYTPEMWNNRTVIVPTSELKKYKRK